MNYYERQTSSTLEEVSSIVTVTQQIVNLFRHFPWDGGSVQFLSKSEFWQLFGHSLSSWLIFATVFILILRFYDVV